MSGRALQYGVGGNLVVQDHRAPAGRFTLRADNRTQVYFTAFFQYLKKNLHFALIRKRMEQEVVQNQQRRAACPFQSPLVFCVVGRFERYERLQQGLAMVVLNLAAVAGSNAEGLCEIGLAAVGRPQNADVQPGIDEVQRGEYFGNTAGQVLPVCGVNTV